MKTTLFPAVLLVASLSLTHALSSQAAESPAPPAESSAPAGNASVPDARIAEIKDPALLTQLIAHYHQSGDEKNELAALDRRIALRPHIGQYRLDKAAFYAVRDKKSEAYTTLIELQNSGYAYDLRDDKRFGKITDTNIWGYIVENLDANRAPFGNAELAYTLPREDLLAESLAFDSTRDRLLVGSARQGKIFIVEADGKLEELASADADNGMWAVFDLVVDAKRGALWVASTAVPHFQGYDPQRHLGRAGIFKFDLKSGKFVKSFLSPPAQEGQGFILSSIALGKDGEVYAADGVSRAIYQVRDDQFRRILHLPMLTSIAAITVSGDGKSLYLADPQLGLIGVDLATLKPFDVRVPAKLSLAGIVSLNWHDDALIAVQSGMNPARVMRFGLSAEGDTITKVLPLVASLPEFGRLGFATVHGEDVYLVANDQKDNYDRFGLLKKKDRLEATRILRFSAISDARDAAQEPRPAGP